MRLVGINAPEVGECFYDQATTALRFIVGSRPVRLVRDRSDVDQYGRLLRYVELADEVDVGRELVRAGFARSQRFEPDTSRSGEYDALQAAAQAAGSGLWAPTACGSPIDGAVSVIVDIEPDAPGDDNFNLNEEWVRFTNAGGAPLDLDGIVSLRTWCNGL